MNDLEANAVNLLKAADQYQIDNLKGWVLNINYILKKNSRSSNKYDILK